MKLKINRTSYNLHLSMLSALFFLEDSCNISLQLIQLCPRRRDEGLYLHSIQNPSTNFLLLSNCTFQQFIHANIHWLDEYSTSTRDVFNFHPQNLHCIYNRAHHVTLIHVKKNCGHDTSQCTSNTPSKHPFNPINHCPLIHALIFFS